MKRKHEEWQDRMNSLGFVFAGAGLGWAGSVILNAGSNLGWLLIVAAGCCLVISYAEQQIARSMYTGGE
jgi:zinc transporter ZupT